MRGMWGKIAIFTIVCAALLTAQENAENNSVDFGLRAGVLNFIGDGTPEAPALMGEASLGLPLSKSFSVNLTGGFGKQKFSPNNESFFTQVASYDFYGMYRFRPTSFIGPMVYLGVGAINFKRGTWPMYWDGSAITGGGLEFKLSQNIGLQVLADYRYTSGDDFDGVTGGGKDAYITAKAGLNYRFKRSGLKQNKEEPDPLLAGDIFDLIQKDMNTDFDKKLENEEKQKAAEKNKAPVVDKKEEPVVKDQNAQEEKLSDPVLTALFGEPKEKAEDEKKQIPETKVDSETPTVIKEEPAETTKAEESDPVIAALFGGSKESNQKSHVEEKQESKLEPVAIVKERKPFPVAPKPAEKPLDIPEKYQQQLDDRQAILNMLNVQLKEKEDRIVALENELQKAAVQTAPQIQNYEEQYIDAVKLYQNRKYADAAGLFAALLQDQPDHRLASNCQYWIGECAYSAKNYENAIDAFKKTLNYANSPKIDDALLMLGQSYRKIGNTDLAEKYFMELLQEQPESEYVPRAKKYLGQSASPVAYLDK